MTEAEAAGWGTGSPALTRPVQHVMGTLWAGLPHIVDDHSCTGSYQIAGPAPGRPCSDRQQDQSQQEDRAMNYATSF